MQQGVKEKARALLENGTVSRVLGWKKGEFCYDLTPAVFASAEEVDRDFVYSDFSGANLSKYLIAESNKEGKIAAFLKPCDSYSFVQLLKEHRICRENVYVVGVACDGMCDARMLEEKGGVLSVEAQGDTLRVESLYGTEDVARKNLLLDRFAEVSKLEAGTPEERFAFWQQELSRCIRCNACRNVCPACSCEKCVFDNPKSGVANKAAADPFEENLFHIIRAFHVAGRCTDCGECSRVCPQHIPLHLLNRKFIRDVDRFSGDYQAGAEVGSRAPLVNYTTEDIEPCDAVAKGGD